MQSAEETASSLDVVQNTDRESDRRSRLIAAANDLLDEAGLEGLTIRAVLKRTGLARRAFYECFAGKDDLVLAVFENSLFDAATHFGKLAEEKGDPLEGIRMVVMGIVVGPYADDSVPDDFVDRRSAAMAREHLRLAESRPDELDAALSPLIGQIAAQVREGIRSGQFRDCDPDLQARLVYNLVSTTAHVALLAEDCDKSVRESRQEMANNIWEFCRRAIIA